MNQIEAIRARHKEEDCKATTCTCALLDDRYNLLLHVDFLEKELADLRHDLERLTARETELLNAAPLPNVNEATRLGKDCE